MYLQPKYELEHESLAGAEALFRWIDPEKGMLPLGEFMPLFEKNGFVRQIDYFIFESALKLIEMAGQRCETGKDIGQPFKIPFQQPGVFREQISAHL